ncbi:MAG: filamentous hemagglutinin N-terminal domain-containing protein, partial [Thermomonas sp.]
MRTKHNSKRIRILRRRRLALALITAMAAPVAMAQDLPDSGSVTSGTASIGPQMGTQMTITQTTKGAIIDWGSFNIGAAYGVTFDQQFGASSVILNRVIGYGYGYGSSGASVINGTLSSNGNVFIINPSGITFGSGAQVNVGGLVASTLDIADADFLSGVSSGQYRFTASGSLAGAIWNNGQLTAADGGTIGLIGSQINNAGTISATNGSVVFGATSQVTLDYFGDGLTQVTVSGNGLGVSNCSINCNGGITSSGNVFAQGGHIEMRSNTMDGASAGNGLFVDPANGGRIWISGNVAAPTAGSRRGSVIIDAGMGNIDLGGVDGKTGNVSANANNAGENAGTIELRGNQLFTHLCYGTGPTDLCNANNRLGLVNASAFGAGGSAGEIHIDVNHFYHGGVLQAVANDGSGGLIDIKANDAEIYNRVWAYGNKGVGGTINFVGNNLLLFRGQQAWLGGPGTAYWSASLLAYGTTTGGAVNIDTGSLVVTDLGNVTPEFDDVIPVINVTGQLGGNGGTININANNASIGDTWLANASGDGQGGNISITADSIDLAGGLVASGASGGTVTTTTTGSFFAGASAYIEAGNWLVNAPSIRITPSSGAASGVGAVLTDAALSATLDRGTVVQLSADAALAFGTSGNIHIDPGVNIQHATSDAVALHMQATGGIYGSYFDIVSVGGPLELSFTANVNGGKPDSGYVSFFHVNLDSNGGDIAMSGEGRGVYLDYSQVASGGGDISISGNGAYNGALLQYTGINSAGGDISIDATNASGTGVRLDNAGISSGGGGITINGDGPDGVSVVYSTLASAGGDISIDGTGIYSGSYFHDSTIDSATGNIIIKGSASQDVTGYYPFGVALAGTTLTSTTGDISVIGDAVGGSGIEFWTSGGLTPGITTASGTIALTSTSKNGLVLEGLGIATDTGDITIVGVSSDLNATAGVFVGRSGLHTNGGDISITGTAAGGSGVFLYYGDLTSNGGDITVLGKGFDYGVRVLGGLVSSDTGDITITGTATTTYSGANATGVHVLDGSFASTSGGISIDGSALYGAGVFFGGTYRGSGASVSTTSGGIVVSSTGLYGLNVADIPFSTDTGDITLQGTASGLDAGVYVGSALTTNGGDISISGSSGGNYGVLVYGDISSAGGNISLFGERSGLVSYCSTCYYFGGLTSPAAAALGGSAGILISGAVINSGGGDLVFSGIDSDGVAGMVLRNATLASGGGAISLHGTSNTQLGIGIYDSTLDSAGGNITLRGYGGGIGILVSNGNITSGGGDILVHGEGGTGNGVDIDGMLDSASGGITLYGHSDGATGLAFGGYYSSLASSGGDISLTGIGQAGGVLLHAYSATDLDSGGGHLAVTGTAYGLDAVGVYLDGIRLVG